MCYREAIFWLSFASTPIIMTLGWCLWDSIMEWLGYSENESREAGVEGIAVQNVCATKKIVKERLKEYTMEIKSCRVVKRANSLTSLVSTFANGGEAGAVVDISTVCGKENSTKDLVQEEEDKDTTCSESISDGGTTKRNVAFFNQLLRSTSLRYDSSGTVPTIVIPKPGVRAPSNEIPVASQKIDVPIGKPAEDDDTNNEVEKVAAAAKVTLTADGVPYRAVPNVCAICLSEYVAGDRVSWSSNEKCVHAFHESCAFQWILQSCCTPENKYEPPRCPCCRNFFLTYGTAARERKEQRQGEGVEIGRRRDNIGHEVEDGDAEDEIGDQV